MTTHSNLTMSPLEEIAKRWQPTGFDKEPLFQMWWNYSPYTIVADVKTSEVWLEFDIHPTTTKNADPCEEQNNKLILHAFHDIQGYGFREPPSDIMEFLKYCQSWVSVTRIVHRRRHLEIYISDICVHINESLTLTPAKTYSVKMSSHPSDGGIALRLSQAHRLCTLLGHKGYTYEAGSGGFDISFSRTEVAELYDRLRSLKKLTHLESLPRV